MPRLGGDGVGLWVGLLLAAGCGVGPTDAVSTQAPAGAAVASSAPAVAKGTIIATGRAGFRIDLKGTAHHVRALERQPDGTYRSVCVDDPNLLRPAIRQPGGGAP